MARGPIDMDLFAGIDGLPDDDETPEQEGSQQGSQEQDNDEQGTQQSATPASSEGTQASAQHEGQPNNPTQPVASAGTPGTPDSNATQNEVVRPDGLVSRPDPNNPQMQNLVDPRTGQIVVPGGPAQRFYQQAMSARSQVSTLNNELTTTKAQLDAYKAAFDANNEHKLAPAEITSALRIMADFRKDAVGTLQRIMGEMQQAGVDLSPILQGGGAQFAPQMIEGVIERKFGPLLQQQQAQTDHAAQVAAATKELDNFIGSTDYGSVHLNTIKELLSRDGTLTLSSAYLKIAEYAAMNGFRMDQPLEAQIAARRQQQPSMQTTATGAQPRPQGNTVSQAPLPNARNMASGIDDSGNAEDVNTQFGHDLSWDAIARQSMRSYGL